jgi:D-alanyl-D-alanine carboxypeptidase
LVRTLTVRAGIQTASVAPLQASAAQASQLVDQQTGSGRPSATQEEPSPAPARISLPLPTRVSAADPLPPSPAKAAPAQPGADPSPSPSTPKPSSRGGWAIQVGAYQVEQEAKERLAAVQSKASKMLTGADAFTETFYIVGTTFYRARFAGLDKDKAEAACKYLKRNDVECVTIKN